MTHEASSDLHALAAAYGIAPVVTDAGGVTRAAPDDVLLAVLQSLDVPITRPDDAARHLAAKRKDIVRCPPVVVAWEGRGRLEVDLRGLSGVEHADVHLDLEDGTQKSARLSAATSWTLPRLPMGAHTARVRLGENEHPVTILSAPPRTHRPADADPRTWGLFAPLYGVGRAAGSGVGDLRDLHALCEVTATAGGGFVGTLPLLCADYRPDAQGRVDVSPYSPVSRLFFNELYLDLERTPEWARSRNAQKRAAEAGPALRALGESTDGLVDPARAYALRRPVLEALAETFFRRPAEAALAEARAAHPAIDDYAAFRSDDARERRLHLYAQVALHRQLTTLSAAAQARGVELYLDLPVGSHGRGFEAQTQSHCFVDGLTAGAPPDLLFSGGQNWGFAPMHPAGMRQDGYRLVRAMLAAHCRYAGILRLDHVMWLHRIYCIPEGFSATQGVYLRQPAEELWAAVCLESARFGTEVVGEDLGTVPDEVTAAMAERGALGMHLVQFGLTPRPSEGLVEPRTEVLASLGTHDTPTFAAFVQGKDIALRRELGHQSPDAADADAAERETLVAAMTATLAARGLCDEDADPVSLTHAAQNALASSAARRMVVSLDDVWGQTEPQNVPGTTEQVPNWRRRARPAETLGQDRAAMAVLQEVHRRRRASPEPMSARGALAPVRTDVTGLTNEDLYLWNEGKHRRAYAALGAHPETHGGQAGCRFAVWAPDATEVSVVGDFNGWSTGRHPLASRATSGIWEGFVPGAMAGDKYKFRLTTRAGAVIEKADPVAFYTEAPPNTASVIGSWSHEWGDEAWMRSRAQRSTRTAPVSIYELHLGSFMRDGASGGWLSYAQLAERIAEHVGRLGFTHVELMPVMEHPFYGSWGYQVTSYFAPSARYGDPEGLMALVDVLHQRGIGVIVDWVPSHFPEDAWALAQFDGTSLFEHEDPRLGFHPDWKSCIFNYGRLEVQSFLVSSALWWLDAFHVDGLRVDGVASMLYRDYSRKEGEWLPNEHGGRENLEAVALLKRLNEAVYQEFPGVQTYAEESTAWPGVSQPTDAGGLGFGYKWDMGWMNDTLEYFKRDPIHRKWHHNELTFRQMYAYSENYVLALSHDEVVHGKGSLLNKMPGDEWQRFANLRLLYGYMFSQPGKKLLFMGGEFGQVREWNHDTSLDWHLTEQDPHQGVMRWVTELNRLYREVPALHERDCEPDGFEWINGGDAEASVLTYLRKDRHGGPVMVALNFTPTVREGYRVGVPRGGIWRCLANSDDLRYGGSDVHNPQTLEADATEAQGRPHSLMLTLPPLAMIAYRPEPA